MNQWPRLAQQYQLDELLVMRLQMLLAEQRTQFSGRKP